MNNNKQNSKGSGVVTVVILVGILLFNLLSARFKQEDMSVVVISTMVVAFITFIVVALSKARAGKSGEKKQSAVELHRPFPQPTAVKSRQPARVLRHADEAEEVVTCAHHTGREKYLEQVEGFYKNGLIDRAEYKILREKYENMDIPEDYH